MAAGGRMAGGQTSGNPAEQPCVAETGASPVGLVLLARIAAEEGATRTELARDLAPMFTHKLSPADWRRSAETETGQLVASGLATETRNRLAATEWGTEAAARFLGANTSGQPWAEVRDVWLVAKALGIEGESTAKLKALLRQDSLRGLIVQKAFGLPLKRNQPVAKIRAQLALVALERAFGNKIKAGFNARDALPAKAGRLLAGQLSKVPRDFGTDARLVAELAAEQAGAKDGDTATLRMALLQGLAGRLLEQQAGKQRAAIEPVAAVVMPTAANDSGPAARALPQSSRPDLAEFTRKVHAAAAKAAEGWPGNRKAYISRVWSAIRSSDPQWGISEIEFKCMLAEAHRSGRIVLANADLKTRQNLDELESSAVLYKNTVWHFVRVEEEGS